MRKCNSCKRDLNEHMFNKDKFIKDGLSHKCKDCRKEYIKNRKKNNPDKFWSKEKIREYDKEYGKTVRRKLYLKNYYLNNKEHINKECGMYRKENKENYKKWRKKYRVEKRKTDVRWRIDENMSRYIGQSLRGHKMGKRWKELVGYDSHKLMAHLESKFTNRMSWENYAEYWEIDHIKPKSLFIYLDYTDEEFRKCWGLENLQPLEKTLNRIKSNKYIG